MGDAARHERDIALANHRDDVSSDGLEPPQIHTVGTAPVSKSAALALAIGTADAEDDGSTGADRRRQRRYPRAIGSVLKRWVAR
ncbi:hypothetical protein C489_08545 [Natrinema versiforme JCM 10478]|uniref:Uncharacterized protein n=1 Tax=Natrinema versiforme JCM 10478 TaxID=1227496 RepID=L9Y1U1_9EURY|nr:hypothetical protein C489_08545 [Natrinema versiforme JCM 10478]